MKFVLNNSRWRTVGHPHAAQSVCARTTMPQFVRRRIRFTNYLCTRMNYTEKDAEHCIAVWELLGVIGFPLGKPRR